MSASASLIFARLPADAGDLMRGVHKRDAAAAVAPTGGLGDQPGALVGEAGVARKPVAST